MKVCIAYDSKYGNGKKCVEYLQSGMSKKGNNVQTFFIRETDPKSLPQADLYIFSAPTHVGSVPMKMKKFLKNLNIKSEGAKYSLITTFQDANTRALEKMTEILQRHNIKKAAEGVKIKVEGMKGPLWDGYQKQLDVFVGRLLK